jgi:hypothetical protein
LSYRGSVEEDFLDLWAYDFGPNEVSFADAVSRASVDLRDVFLKVASDLIYKKEVDVNRLIAWASRIDGRVIGCWRLRVNIGKEPPAAKIFKVRQPAAGREPESNIVKLHGRISRRPPAIFDGDLAVKLEGLAGLSLDRSAEILQMPCEAGMEEFGTVLRAQTAIIGTATATQARVDEAKFRAKQETSVIEDILAKCKDIQRLRDSSARNEGPLPGGPVLDLTEELDES